MTASYLLLLSSSSSARALAPATRPAGSAAAGNMPCGPGMSRCSATTCSVDTKVGRLEETVPEPPRRAAVTSGGPWASGRTTAYSSGRLTLNFGRMYRRDGRAGHAVALPYVLHRVNLARRTCSASRPTPPKLSPVVEGDDSDVEGMVSFHIFQFLTENGRWRQDTHLDRVVVQLPEADGFDAPAADTFDDTGLAENDELRLFLSALVVIKRPRTD